MRGLVFLSEIFFLLAIKVEFTITPDTDPLLATESGCAGKRFSCRSLALPLILRQKHEMFGIPLEGWKYDPICRCNLPPQQRLPLLQYLHIPKAGTSVNWFLHDYFDCLDPNATNPCMRWLESEEEQKKGLCNGRLFSCMGHSVSPSLPQHVIHGEAYLVTFLREPWKRIQSDFHYVRSRPWAGHLGPNIDLRDAISSSLTILQYALYPGISNCMTKMFNGYYCGDVLDLTDDHLITAKSVLDHALFVGITEYFRTSLCLFSWMVSLILILSHFCSLLSSFFQYGGKIKPLHFNVSRAGGYFPLSFSALSEDERNIFFSSEKYDLALYHYALQSFKRRQSLLRCPILDSDNVT